MKVSGMVVDLVSSVFGVGENVVADDAPEVTGDDLGVHAAVGSGQLYACLPASSSADGMDR